MKSLKYLPIFIFFLILPSAVKADNLEDNKSFFITPQYEIQSRGKVNATLKIISDHSYAYVEDGYFNSLSQDAKTQVLQQLNELMVEFNSRIYPIETQFFGSEPNPGIDNDPRVTILFAPLKKNAGGYFDNANEYTPDKIANSNQREMLYLNIQTLSDFRKIKSFLAHEFQHLISFNQKENKYQIQDDVWLNELRSEFTPTLLGYNDEFKNSNLDFRLQAFRDNASDSLTEWKNEAPDYGQVALFGEYIAEHWSANVIANTLKTSSTGIVSINEALAAEGFQDKFIDVFTSWAIANILNNSTTNSKFTYSRDDLKSLKVFPTKVLVNLGDTNSAISSEQVKDWQPYWYSVEQFASGQKDTLRINFASYSLESFYIPYIIFKKSGQIETKTFTPSQSNSQIEISGIGNDFDRVVFVIIKKDKIGGFTDNEQSVSISLVVDRFSSPELTKPELARDQTVAQVLNQSLPKPPTSNIVNGSLIRAKGDYKVYISKDNWIRHIINSSFLKFYPRSIQEIDSTVLSSKSVSNLIRYEKGTRVYRVDEKGYRHWLNISGKQFISLGLSRDPIFSVSLSELYSYKLGGNIRR